MHVYIQHALLPASGGRRILRLRPCRRPLSGCWLLDADILGAFGGIGVAFDCIVSTFGCIGDAFSCIGSAFGCIGTAFGCIGAAFSCTGAA